MRRVVHAARGLAHRMGRAGGIRAIGEAGQHRPHAHVVPRLEVVALRVRDPQVAATILHRQQRHRIGEGLVIGHGVTLDRVGQRVHAGSGRDAGREIDAERGIDQRHPGRDVGRAADIEFHLSVRVRDHRPERDFAAGAGGGGDRHQWRDAGVDRVFAPFVLRDAAAMDDDHADPLRGVNRAAAADRHQAVTAFRLVVAGAGVDERDAGVGAHLVVGDRVETSGAQRLERLVEQPGFHDSMVGDDQRALDGQCCGLLAKGGERPDGMHHAGRRLIRLQDTVKHGQRISTSFHS